MLKLKIKRHDGSLYWEENFSSQLELDKWLAEEVTRPYWDPSFTTETDDLTPAAPTSAQIAASKLNKIRATRDGLLTQTDFMMMSDYPMSKDKKAAMVSYRQALRDLPEQQGLDLDNPVFPAKPV